MIVAAALHVLLTLSNVRAESHTSSLSVEEGAAVTLRCVFPGSNGSDMQWLTPRGYISYFNGEKVLKDRRHQLVESSMNKLIIRLSNITRADEGVYSCLYYSSPVQTKTVRVSVLAAPSPPSIEVVRISGKSRKEKYHLICSTSGGRPCPRLTWLINDHTEVVGHHKRRLESDGRCTAISTLKVSAASHTRATCVVRHRTLTPGNLTASYSFHTSPAVPASQITEDTHHHPSEAATTSPPEKHTADGKTSGRKREDATRADGTSTSLPDSSDVNPTSGANKAISIENFTAASDIERTTTAGADGIVTTEAVTFPSFSSLVTDDTTTGTSNDTTTGTSNDTTTGTSNDTTTGTSNDTTTGTSNDTTTGTSNDTTTGTSNDTTTGTSNDTTTGTSNDTTTGTSNDTTTGTSNDTTTGTSNDTTTGTSNDTTTGTSNDTTTGTSNDTTTGTSNDTTTGTSNDTTTGTSNDTTTYDVSSARTSYRTLILVLVSAMLCVLLVIVHLLLLKLRKAHHSWKKENEASDQTLESTKSRSNNEETSSQNRSATAATIVPVNANHKVLGIRYNNRVSM